MKTRLVLFGILGVVLIAMLIAGGWAYRYYTAPIRGKVSAEEKIESGANRIDKYNHFFNLCAKAQEYQDKIEIQEDQLENANGKDERESIQTRLSGLKGMFSNTVRRYNQDARKSYTAARFKSSKLPFQLPTDVEKPVVCNIK